VPRVPVVMAIWGGGIQARPDWPPWMRHSVKQMARPKLLSYAHNKPTKTKAWFNRLHHPARKWIGLFFSFSGQHDATD